MVSWPARSGSRPAWRSDTRPASGCRCRTFRRMRRPRRSGRSGRRTPMPGPSSTSPATAGRPSRRPSRSVPSSGGLARPYSPAPRVAHCPADRRESGWIPDDGDVSRVAVARARRSPAATDPARTRGRRRRSGGNLLVIVGLIVLVLAVAAWRWRRSRRSLRFLAPGDRQWRRLALAADRAGVGAAAVGDDLRVRRLAGGADSQAAAGDPHHRRRQGLAELLGPRHHRRRDRPHGGRLEAAAVAAGVAGRAPAPARSPAQPLSRGAPRASQRQRRALRLVLVQSRMPQQVGGVVPRLDPP